MGIEFVAAGDDACRRVDAEGADGFELADHGGTIGGDRGSDAGDHRVIAGQALAVVMHLGGERVDRHVAAGGVDHLDRVTPRLAFLDDAAGGIIVLAAEHGDAQGALWLGGADAGGVIDVIAEFGLQEPVRGDNRDMILERLTAQEHAACHAGAVGEGDLDGPCIAAHRKFRGDDIAQFPLAIRRGHIAPVDDRRGTGDDQVIAARNGMHGKADLGARGRTEGFDVEGMQRRGARAGIDLGLDRGHAKIGQSDPFLPAELQGLGAVWRIGHRAYPVAFCAARVARGASLLGMAVRMQGKRGAFLCVTC